jgi:hypothetical protein
MRRAAVLPLLAIPLQAFATEDVTVGRPEPIDRYLMNDRSAEVALARSAAPPAVGARAAVWVLERGGYREAAAGENGFVCLVGRSWSAPIRFVSGRPNPEFWSPAVKAPMCLNAEAVRTILPPLVRRTELALLGRSLGEVEADTKERFAVGTYRPPQGVAMSYMLSRDQHLGHAVGHFVPHVMLYAPHAERKEWGALETLSGFPFVGENEGNPHALVIIPLGRWSDGSPALHDLPR